MWRQLRKSLLLIAFAFAEQNSFGQLSDNIPPDFGKRTGIFLKVTKKNLQAIINKSIRQSEPTKVSFPSNPWIACNQDSSFYKMDTIYFRTNNYYTQPNSDCCQFINWTFYDPDAFIRTLEQTCKEPASAKSYTDDDNFKIVLTDNSGVLYMQLFNRKKLVDNFRVFSLERQKKSGADGEFEIIKLIRQR